MIAPEPHLASQTGPCHRHCDRILVDIKAHECAIIRHGSSPLGMRLCYSQQSSFQCCTLWRRATNAASTLTNGHTVCRSRTRWLALTDTTHRAGRRRQLPPQRTSKETLEISSCVVLTGMVSFQDNAAQCRHEYAGSMRSYHSRSGQNLWVKMGCVGDAQVGRYLGLCCRVGSKLVGHHDTRRSLAFQEFAQEPLGSGLVPSRLDQDVEHVAVPARHSH